MFKNNLTPPPQKKVPHIGPMLKSNAIMITTTADDATINVISWNHDFPSQNSF